MRSGMRFSRRRSISASQRCASSAERKCMVAGARSATCATGARARCRRAARSSALPASAASRPAQREQAASRASSAASCSCRKAGAPASGRSCGLSSRRPLYSTLPAARPRSPSTTRCGMPISSMSANSTPGRSSRSSSSTSMPGRSELGVELVGRRAHLRALAVADRHQADLERRHRRGKDDAALVVVLLDRGGDDARHADAVAAHLERLRRCRSRRGRWPSSPRSTWCAAGRCARPRCRARSRACPCRPGSGRRRPRCGCRRPRGSGRSRPQLTPVRWKPSSFAPQTKSLIAATVRSAIDLDLGADRADVARLAAERAPISASVAKRNAPIDLLPP